ncbi:hypothetical protein [Pseudomonas aeruginosa]|uniref:hypothetical protein n=1 Tax=Pseudomonas aeruginosa TaxID=287 RepID=UPI0022BA5BFE|nr:hypothetical protein [Pseudomonas aeruginosa]WBJ42272.1 hypothetical protein PALA42_03968 [Pseudomonas aeruginosa]
MAEPPVDYQISAADAHELAGAVLLPADLRRQVLEKMAAQRNLAAMLDLFAQVLGMANAVAENCRAMVELILIERGEHPHTAEQANLPTMFGALQGVVLAATVDPRGTCAGCAYRLGTPANTSPVTTSDAIYCRQELSRFYCHADLDDQGNPVRTCVGHAKAMKQDATDSNLVARATNYLAAKGLAGTPLRDPPAPVEQAGRDVEPAPCPFCGGEVDPTGWLRGDGTRGPECNDCGATARSMEAWQTRAAPTGQTPQAWLDVQAERKRQITAEGWTPEHDDEHDGGELADAAACYALSAAGWSTYAARERWPWPLEWWKPSTARRDLVKACALGLAEIERLDRAGISQNPQPGATTASS